MGFWSTIQYKNHEPTCVLAGRHDLTGLGLVAGRLDLTHGNGFFGLAPRRLHDNGSGILLRLTGLQAEPIMLYETIVASWCWLLKKFGLMQVGCVLRTAGSFHYLPFISWLSWLKRLSERWTKGNSDSLRCFALKHASIHYHANWKRTLYSQFIWQMRILDNGSKVLYVQKVLTHFI